MKIPKVFVPEKDLTKKINYFLEEKPSSLYDHVKRVYEGSGGKNMFLLYGPPGTGKTFISKKTEEEISKEYNIFHINLQPTDSFSVIKSEYFEKIENKIILASSLNKKVYIDIVAIEKFSNPAQEALDSILVKYKNNKGIVFVFQSYSKCLKGQVIDIEFTKNKL